MPFLGGIDSGSVPSPGRNVASGNDAPNPVPAIPAAVSGGGIDSGGTPMPGQIVAGSFSPPLVPNPLAIGATGPTGSAGPAGPSGGGIASVANAAAAPSTDQGPGLTPAGTLLYVQTFHRYYRMEPTSGATVDGVTVLNGSGGLRRWVWLQIANDNFWLAQTVWGINPSTGSDENVGSVVSPLATWGEFARRMNIISILQPFVAATSVTILGDLPSTDPITLEAWLAEGIELDVFGTPTNVGTASSFTAVTAQNRTAPGTQWSVTDAVNGAANFVAGNVGLQLKDTTVSSVGWIDAAPGGGVANLTNPCAPNASGGSPFGSPTPVSLVNGDNYQILRPSQAVLGTIRFHGKSSAVTPGNVRFFNLWFTGTNISVVELFGNFVLRFEQCRFDQALQFTCLEFAQCVLSNCWLPGGVQVELGGLTVAAGEIKTIATASGPVSLSLGTDLILRTALQVNNGANVSVGNVASLGGQASIFTFNGNNGTIRHTGIMWGNPTNYNSLGSQRGGFKVFYPNGSFAATFGQLPGTALVTFPASTGSTPRSYDPTSGLWGAAPAGGTSLTNIPLAIGGGGYAGAVFDPVTNSSFGPT